MYCTCTYTYQELSYRKPRSLTNRQIFDLIIQETPKETNIVSCNVIFPINFDFLGLGIFICLTESYITVAQSVSNSNISLLPHPSPAQAAVAHQPSIPQPKSRSPKSSHHPTDSPMGVYSPKRSYQTRVQKSCVYKPYVSPLSRSSHHTAIPW